MLSGFYTAASGMLVQKRNLNVISNNLVNSQTPGYKTDTVVMSTFEHSLMTRLEENNDAHIGSGSPVSLVDEVVTNYSGSSLDETSRPFDMAIVGDGFFNIQGDNRQYLTRNGNFDVDDEGYLVLSGYGRVLGENGAIQVNGSDFTVNNDGSVYGAANNYLGKLLITTPAEGSKIQKYDNGLYTADNVNTVETPTVYQNAIERSNTDMNQEYTRMLEAQRAFTSCSNALKIADEMNAKGATLASIT